MSRYKIIVNPTSGRGAGERAVPLIEENLRAYDLDFELVRTEHPWHAAELAQQAAADGCEVVVAAGGDGTLNEVLNGLVIAKQAGTADGVAMGMLCVGRGNDFAFGADVPNIIGEGCRVLAEGRRRTMDVGRVSGGYYPQGRYFGNGVGIGFDAVVGFEALKMKHLHGFLCYLVAALKTVFLYDNGPLLRIEYDEQVLVQRSLMVSIMNGKRMGGSFMMAPYSKLDDGLLDLCIAKQVSRAGIFTLIPHVMRGTQETHAAFTTGRARHIVVTAIEGSLPAHADGETLCTEGEQLTVDLLAAQLELICDSRRAAGDI